MKRSLMTLILTGGFVICSGSLASVPHVSEKQSLKDIVFSNKYPLEQRWEAYHQIVTKNKNESMPMARKAIQSKEWFLREAGLKTFVALNPEAAKTVAKDMFEKDPSMLVRAQALSAIKILNDKTTENLLWKALKDPKNFRGDQSLWIRPKVVATLMEFKMGEKAQYKNLLDDKDPQIQRLAKEALKKY
jgi:HEAT repeat protein